MKRSAALFALLLALAAGVMAAPTEYATCTGSDSCNACKNCSSCKHCHENGGTCGVCKK